METKNIVEFLKLFPDDRIAALLAHAEDGKLAFHSCCCLIGSLNAPHPLRVSFPQISENTHQLDVRHAVPFAELAESEFRQIGDDEERRQTLIPLIKAEFQRRDNLRVAISQQEVEYAAL